VSQPVDGVDARTDRVAQATIGVALLAAFVFRLSWIVSILTIVVAIGALAGPIGNGLHRTFERFIAPRLPAYDRTAPGACIDAVTVRAQDALAAAILAVATIAFVLGIGLVGWVLTVAEAVIAIMAATTGIHVADRIRRRF